MAILLSLSLVQQWVVEEFRAVHTVLHRRIVSRSGPMVSSRTAPISSLLPLGLGEGGGWMPLLPPPSLSGWGPSEPSSSHPPTAPAAEAHVPSLAPAAGATEGRRLVQDENLHSRQYQVPGSGERQVCSRCETPPEKGKAIPREERLVNAGSVLFTWQAKHSSSLVPLKP